MTVFRSRMTMRTTVQRNEAATDDWGNPGAPGWADHLPDVACYATVHTGQEIVGGARAGETGQVVALTELHVYMPEHSDVTTADRLLDITDRQDSVLFKGPFDIKSVDLRPHRLLDVLVRSSL